MICKFVHPSPNMARREHALPSSDHGSRCTKWQHWSIRLRGTSTAQRQHQWQNVCNTGNILRPQSNMPCTCRYTCLPIAREYFCRLCRVVQRASSTPRREHALPSSDHGSRCTKWQHWNTRLRGTSTAQRQHQWQNVCNTGILQSEHACRDGKRRRQGDARMCCIRGKFFSANFVWPGTRRETTRGNTFCNSGGRSHQHNQIALASWADACRCTNRTTAQRIWLACQCAAKYQNRKLVSALACSSLMAQQRCQNGEALSALAWQ